MSKAVELAKTVLRHVSDVNVSCYIGNADIAFLCSSAHHLAQAVVDLSARVEEMEKEIAGWHNVCVKTLKEAGVDNNKDSIIYPRCLGTLLGFWMAIVDRAKTPAAEKMGE